MTALLANEVLFLAHLAQLS